MTWHLNWKEWTAFRPLLSHTRLGCAPGTPAAKCRLPNLPARRARLRALSKCLSSVSAGSHIWCSRSDAFSHRIKMRAASGMVIGVSVFAVSSVAPRMAAPSAIKIITSCLVLAVRFGRPGRGIKPGDKAFSRRPRRNRCQSALNSFQVTASKSFHLVSPISAVSYAV
jgi:hypothetical protein